MAKKKRGGESRRDIPSFLKRLNAIDAELQKIKQREKGVHKKYGYKKIETPKILKKPTKEFINPKPRGFLKPKPRGFIRQKPKIKPLEEVRLELKKPKIEPRIKIPTPILPKSKPMPIKLPEIKPEIKRKPIKLPELKLKKAFSLIKNKKTMLISSLVIVFGVVVNFFVPSSNYIYFILMPLIILTLFLLIIYFLIIFIKEKHQKEISSPELIIPEAIKEKHIQNIPKFKTKLDELYTVIKRDGIVTVKNIAERFNISFESAEGWVRILEKEGLIKVTSPIFGQINVRVVEKTPTIIKELKKFPEEKISQFPLSKEKPDVYNVNKDKSMVVFKTPLDDVYNTIKSLDKVYLDYIAKKFKIPLSAAERWVLLLEDRGLVKVKYPIFGKIEILAVR